MIALLRGVTPTGKNRIPKMSYLEEILTDAGFKEVKTYIQSGNVLLDTDLSLKETANKIHKVIQKNIGADLAVILKTKEHWGNDMKSQGYDMLLTSTQVDEEVQHFYRKLGYKDCGGFVIDVPGYEQPKCKAGYPRKIHVINQEE